jgi:protein-S-isoprenylcysteine O-methyltransferase Ste14
MKKLLIPPVFVLISLILIITFYFKLPAYNCVPYPLNLCGTIFICVGFMIMAIASRLFRKHKTTLTFDKSTHLVTEGIYSRTRNPIYLGMFIMLIGIGICFGNLFSIIMPFGFIIIIRLMIIPKEEKLMFEAFGQDYLDYKKKVRRWI